VAVSAAKIKHHVYGRNLSYANAAAGRPKGWSVATHGSRDTREPGHTGAGPAPAGDVRLPCRRW
jgi:hypothetical protein